MTVFPVDFADLEAYARKLIAADRFPNDEHVFKLVKCANCGVVPFSLTIEHHTGSKHDNFRGVIWAQCPTCGNREKVLSFTGQQRKFEKSEVPACSCGNSLFIVGECERFERDEGLPGFFDEGVVVGACSLCGQKRALVFTD